MKRGVEMPFLNQIGMLLFFMFKFIVQIYGKLGEEIWEIKRRFIKKMGGDKWVLVNNK